MRGPAATEQLTGSESLLWTIERDPVLRSTVVVLFLLDGKPDVDLVRQRISAASEEFPRLHQRITTSRTGPPRWSMPVPWTSITTCSTSPSHAAAAYASSSTWVDRWPARRSIRPGRCGGSSSSTGPAAPPCSSRSTMR